MLRVALVQMNSTVGDLAGNARRIAEGMEQARRDGADVVAFPELALTGYPPEDLLFRPRFVTENRRWLDWLAERSRGLTALVGFVDRDGDLYNAAAVLHDGRLAAVYRKMALPNYGVFDEYRYFRPGTSPLVLKLNGTSLGLSICEDIWYPGGPAEAEAVAGGAEVLINLSASPYHVGKVAGRDRMLATRAADYVAALLYVNLVGGQDELVFDGHSRAFDEKGNLAAGAMGFAEDYLLVEVQVERIFQHRLVDPRWRRPALADGPLPLSVVELPPVARPARTTHLLPGERLRGAVVPVASGSAQHPEAGAAPASPADPDPEAAEVYAAITLAIRDYVRKNGFSKVVLGLSGGIDSAVTACLAVDALGAENVVGVSNPSRFSSEHSKEDARSLAEALGITFYILPIEPVFKAYEELLAPVFAGRPFDVAEENLQARIRGTIWMALANKFGWLLLSTSNKSEAAVGYGTLYGDMAGGFAPLKDVSKLMVYRLARYRNRRGPGQPIPESTLAKPPSAELRPDQKDTDSLPPYELLDPILAALVEEDLPPEAVIAMGYPEEEVRRTAQMLFRSEYKRRQTPPGVKVTPRAFGRDRRYPITNRFREISS